MIRVAPHPVPRRATTGTATVPNSNNRQRFTIKELARGASTFFGTPLVPQGPPANRRQQIVAAVKKVERAIRTEGINNREGLPDHLEGLLNALVRSGELRKTDRVKVMCQSAQRMADLEVESTMSKGVAAVEVLTFTYADLTTDVLMITKYYSEGRSTEASLMGYVTSANPVVELFFNIAFTLELAVKPYSSM